MKKIMGVVLLGLSLAACDTEPRKVSAVMHNEKGRELGTVTFRNNRRGLKVTVDLNNVTPGVHGFHVHENPDCAPMVKDGKMQHALAAGGHYDPDKTGKHLGPEGGGHKGDLPKITARADGSVKEVMYIKGLNAADFKDRSLMIHAGGDNYSDDPAPLGGGGARIACGIIE